MLKLHAAKELAASPPQATHVRVVDERGQSHMFTARELLDHCVKRIKEMEHNLNMARELCKSQSK